MANWSRHSREIEAKQALTITEMAGLVGLSRSRFHQLMGTVFPLPVYDPRTRRPFFTQEQQRAILDLKANNCGIDGKPVLFYTRRSKRAASKAKLRHKLENATVGSVLATQLTKGVQSLGLKTVSPAEVEDTLRRLYPNGTDGIATIELVRSVFLEQKRRATTDPVGG
jgi:hypothetical protein